MNFNGIYCCNFGCPIESDDKAAIIRHLVVFHTSKELFCWGYRKDKLKKMLSPQDLAEVLK